MLTPEVVTQLRDRITVIVLNNRSRGARPGRYTALEEAAFEEGRLAALNLVLVETGGSECGGLSDA